MLERRRVVGIRRRGKYLRNMLSLGIWIPIVEPSLDPWIRSHVWIWDHGFLNRHSLVRIILKNVLLSDVRSCLLLVIGGDYFERFFQIFLGIRFRGVIPGISIRNFSRFRRLGRAGIVGRVGESRDRTGERPFIGKGRAVVGDRCISWIRVDGRGKAAW